MAVARLARAKGWGYWQTVEYLAKVESAWGTKAALFELELQRALDEQQAKAERGTLEYALRRQR